MPMLTASTLEVAMSAEAVSVTASQGRTAAQDGRCASALRYALQTSGRLLRLFEQMFQLQRHFQGLLLGSLQHLCRHVFEPVAGHLG